MKKTTILTMIAAALMAAGCDKIEPDERLISVGNGGDSDPWPEGAVAYVEKYTGPKCNNCPSADRTLERLHAVYGSHLVVVSVTAPNHSMGEPFPNSMDTRVSEAAAWENHWGFTSLPTAYINRQGAAFSSSMADIGNSIDQALATLPPVKVEVSASADGNTVTINTGMELREACSEDLTLTLLVTEDSLKYMQLDGTGYNEHYAHNHMLRAVVTDSWGKSVSIGTEAGASASDQTTYTIGIPAIVKANSHIVALVCDAATHRVMGCAQCDIR